MIVRDWRQADARRLRACYEAERRSWRVDLAWETDWTWNTIEQARSTWGLPGFVALGGKGIDGWAFYVCDGDAAQIGGLVAATPDATTALLDAILDAATPRASRLSCFIRDRAPGLSRALAERGFDVEPFIYLSRQLSAADGALAPADGEERGRRWTAADVDDVAELLSAAYTIEGARHFAPGGRVEDWRQYVRGIAQQAGCGTLDAEATRVVRIGSQVCAVAMVTSIAPDTAHVAQLAVHPSVRGRGVAGRLVADAIARAARTGRTAVTLLVGSSNHQARRLYASAGFAERASFVSAHRTTVNFCLSVSAERTQFANARPDFPA